MPLRVLVQPFVMKIASAAQELAVTITVINAGRDLALFQEMSCSWQQAYRTDHAAISFGIGMCVSNVMQTRLLAPGQHVVHARVPLNIYKSLPRKVSFRIGLVQPDVTLTSDEIKQLTVPNAEMHLPERIIATRGKGTLTYWSEPVTVRSRTRWWNTDQDFVQVMRQLQKRRR